MDFELNEDQKMLKDTARKFMEKEVIPIAADYDNRKEFPPKELIKKLVPLGYVGCTIPEEDGGAGGDYLSYFLLVEELGRAWPSLRSVITTNELVLTTIYRRGNEDQRKRFLPELLSGDKLCFFGLTEPNVGSDAGSVETRAVRDGDSYVINGTKTLITSGSKADLGLVLCSTDKSKGPKGISALIVEKDKCSYKTSDMDKMGMDASVLSEVCFEDCRVSRDNLLGEEGEGLKIALATLNVGRCSVAFSCLGAAEACIEAAVEYVKERKQFGKAIGSFQLVQELIADMVMEFEALRLMALRAAVMVNKGQKCNKEASLAKIYASEAALRIAEKAIQVHGGYGYTKEFPVERFYRDIRHLTIAEGTNQIQRLIVGKEVLGISAIA